MAITRSAALAEMASGIAHELNQPLGAIATFAQAGVRMLERPNPMISQAVDVLKQINQEALNAGDGIRRIRRLFDQEDKALTRVQMSRLIDEMRPVLDVLARHYDGVLELKLDDPAVVNIDAAKIKHVVFSLAQNGFEAAHEGGVNPRVAISVSSDRYSVETSVLDSGRGVSDGIKGRIFRPFQTTKTWGTGLGLASSHAIVEAHGGSIGFENSTGGGCRFWFRIPLTPGEENGKGN